MKKCGILSIFYKNYNYGGQLQAYAMCKAIEKTGNSGEQICYVRDNHFYLHKVKTVLKKSRKVRWNYYWRYFNRFLLKFDMGAEYAKGVIKKFDAFFEQVPHSKVYHSENVLKTCDRYDVFLSGSDQVWNPDNCTDEWFFNFLPEDKRRVAYSASIGKEQIEKKEKVRLKPLIEKYEYIGVRENEAKRLLHTFVQKDIKVVLDPVMLLDAKEWSVFDKWDFLKRERYICVYLVSYEKKVMKKIREYAEKLGEKAVFITDPRNVLNQNPKGFWIPFENGVGPEEFVALFLNANYIFTNSFHGTALALNFHKDFFVFYSRPVEDKENLNSRINTVLDNFEVRDRLTFLNENLSMKDLKRKIDYSSKLGKRIEEKRNECQKYLAEIIQGEKEKQLGKNT